MKKVLFIDRDGTLVMEPPVDYQLDSLEKLEFYPGVFRYLSKIVEELEFELVMVTNQDGLGTASFPEADFWPAQNKIIQAFKNEGISFSEILIDKSLPEEQAETRKPGLGMVQKYLYGPYDLADSFVIGDRITDLEFAKNMQAKGILISEESHSLASFNSSSWAEIYDFLKGTARRSSLERKTKETEVKVSLNLDGKGKAQIDTGLAFLDHMLDQIARHAGVDLNISVKGDLEVDEHHTMEDLALCLGEAFKQALGNKKGIERYGFLLPMDDCLAQVAIDFGGRPWLVWEAEFQREYIGQVPTEMFYHFFKSFSDAAACNLNIKAEGSNEHHKIESVFKAFAKAIRMAIQKNDTYQIPSTKGSL